MTPRAVIALGRLSWQTPDRVGPDDGGHQVRVGWSYKRITSERQYALWLHTKRAMAGDGLADTEAMIGYFGSSLTTLGLDGTAAARRVRADIDELVALGVLLPVPRDDVRHLGLLLRALRGIPQYAGLGNSPAAPHRWGIGVPGAQVALLTDDELDLWLALQQSDSVDDAVRRLAGGDLAVIDPTTVLARVGALVALDAIYLDVARLAAYPHAAQ